MYCSRARCNCQSSSDISFEEATGCAKFIEAVAFSSRCARNDSCVDCRLNEYLMDRIGDSDFAVDGCRAFVTSSIGDMFDAVLDGLRDELLHGCCIGFNWLDACCC